MEIEESTKTIESNSDTMNTQTISGSSLSQSIVESHDKLKVSNDTIMVLDDNATMSCIEPKNDIQIEETINESIWNSFLEKCHNDENSINYILSESFEIEEISNCIIDKCKKEYTFNGSLIGEMMSDLFSIENKIENNEIRNKIISKKTELFNNITRKLLSITNQSSRTIARDREIILITLKAFNVNDTVVKSFSLNYNQLKNE